VVAPAPAASADDSDTKQASAVADKGLREHSHAGRTLAILGGLALIVTVAIVTLGIVAKGHSATAERSGDENARAWPSAPLRSPTPPHAPAGASAEHALTPAAAGRQEEEKGEDENAPDQEVVTRVRRVLDSKAVGSFILSGYLHWGAPYNGHQFVQQAAVTFGGKVAPKRFGLVYRFRWDNDGLTDVAFLCDESGLIYAVQVLKTNAGMSKPFFAADAALAVGSFGIAAALDDRLTPEQKQSLIDTARQADAKASLESALGLLTSLQ
jgi:hypothetical protein